MDADKKQMFINRLTKVYRHRSKQARRQNISCYRLYDHDLPEFPFAIDFYADKLNVSEYRRRHGMTEEDHDAWMDESMEVVSNITGVEFENIFTRQRRRKAGRQGQYEKIDAAKNEFIVEENGLQFKVNLSDYLDTGLFLDHRITREMIRKESLNLKVLNLFCYTGSFSVYAAAGKASEVVSVDLSKTYLQWAEENMKLNGFADAKKYKYVHTDVMQYLITLPANYFDLIILDPPTFSNSKRMKDFMDVQRDHVFLINSCLSGLRSGGRLYFSTNYTRFVLDSEKIAATSIKDITRLTTPFDFEGKLGRFCFKMENPR
jgi:23S rRNA (cytosine1962-C5)-methyltransferase